jgi:hypothetical protein
MRARDRIAKRRRGLVSEPEFSRHLEKCASLRRCDVALLLAALFTIERQIEHDLLAVGKQIVQPIDLASGVRESPASTHHAMEVVVVLRLEGDQHGDDRVPRAGASGHDQVAPDVATASIVASAHRGQFISVGRGRTRREVEHADMLRERSDHQIDLDRRNFLRGDRGAGFHQHFEPHAETIGVEALVQAGFASAPQVEVEDTRQLVRCGQRHELAAILESTAPDDAVEHFGLQPRNHVRDVRNVQNAIEQRALVSSGLQRLRTTTPGTMDRFRHGPAMIPARAPKKQS